MTLEAMTVQASDCRTTFAIQKPSGETFVFDVTATETGIEISPVRLAATPIYAPRVDRVGSDGFVDR